MASHTAAALARIQETDRVPILNGSALPNGLTIIKLSQAEYDLLTPDENTLYIIVG